MLLLLLPKANDAQPAAAAELLFFGQSRGQMVDGLTKISTDLAI